MKQITRSRTCFPQREHRKRTQPGNLNNMMKTWLRLTLALALFAAIWLLGGALEAQQTTSAGVQATSDKVFKNVQVLKGIPVDDFMGTMGIMCAALGFDCS